MPKAQETIGTRQVSPNKAKSSILHALKIKRPIFLWGGPGIGKSEVVHQIGDEYKGVCDDLIPKDNSNITYNPLSYDDNPDFKKSYWKRRDNALNSFTEGDENLNEHYYIAGFAEKFDYEQQKILGLNTPYVNFVINNDKD